MSSSFALWCERHGNDHFRPRPADIEVHINLWRHVRKWRRDGNFIEVGLLFRDSYEIGKVSLFIPATLKPAQVIDLSPKLKSNTTLSAVFNDAVVLGSVEDERWFSTDRLNKHFATIHRFKAGLDYSFELIGAGETAGTLLTFGADLCQRLRSAGPHYVRMRLLLDPAAAREFSFDAEAADTILPTSVQATEITEIRFNELRNVPAEVLTLMGKRNEEVFRISAAHCFIMRDLEFELTDSHASFHKMRLLEANLWKEYLAEDVAADAAKRMIVYHWKVSASPSKEVESFIALAKFRRSRLNLAISSIGIIILGALGSASEAKISAWIGGETTQDHGWAFIVLACLFLLLIAYTMLPSLWRLAKRVATGGGFREGRR